MDQDRWKSMVDVFVRIWFIASLRMKSEPLEIHGFSRVSIYEPMTIGNQCFRTSLHMDPMARSGRGEGV